MQFLRWFCREDYLDEIEGAITEIFNRHQGSPARARWQFFWNVLKHFRPEFIRPVNLKPPYNYNAMIRNYFKTSFRSLVRNKSYALINITGLATGIAVCMLIFIIIQYQTSFDTFHPKKDRAYRVLTVNHHTENANITYDKSVPYPMPVGLKTNFPQAEEVAPIFASHNDELIVPGYNGEPQKSFGSS
jgi:hypothetical protein